MLLSSDHLSGPSRKAGSSYNSTVSLTHLSHYGCYRISRCEHSLSCRGSNLAPIRNRSSDTGYKLVTWFLTKTRHPASTYIYPAASPIKKRGV